MATKKKFFYYKNKVSSRKTSAVIYQLKNNNLKYIGTSSWLNASNKGADSEVYRLLYNKKLVPIREYKANGGYYYWRTNKSVKIEEI